MPSKGLALTLSGLLAAAAPAHADEPAFAAPRLERRAAERGPIRRHLEAALATPAVEIAAQALDASREDARQALSPASSSSLSWRVGTLLVLASLVAIWMAWARGWREI